MPQATTITLTDDASVDFVYTSFKTEDDRRTYKGPNWTLSTRDDMILSRKFAKANGNSQGISETVVRFAVNATAPGRDVSTSVEHLCTVDVKFRIAVGVDEVVIDSLISKLQGLSASELIDLLVKGMEV